MRDNRINLALGLFWLGVTAAGVVLYIVADIAMLPFCILSFVVGAMFLGLYFSLRTIARDEREKQRRQSRGDGKTDQ